MRVRHGRACGGVCGDGVVVGGLGAGARCRVGSPHAEVRPHEPPVVFVVDAIGASVFTSCPCGDKVGLVGREGCCRRAAPSNGSPGSLILCLCEPKAFHLSAGCSNCTLGRRANGSNLMRIVWGGARAC